ncbi:MAG TPA: RsmE family RNA methyltransferase [Acidimicrobiales bacterium]|nr:RsmE family RNA methyltransferase [Acidimicrobiales bacterium]
MDPEIAGPGPAPLVFVADLTAPALDDGDRHHLERALRLRSGDEVTASDGRGRWRPCQLRAGGELEPTGLPSVVPAPTPALTVAFALTKGGRPELAVQKLTELGVDRIVPFAAGRSVARWEGDRAERHLARLRRVAREAAMQSRRAHLPTVAALTDFAGAAALPGAALADRGGRPPSLAHPTLLVGPEGGWTSDELAAGLPVVGLGPQVLRAETAALAAAALLAALRSNLLFGRGTA